MKRMLKPLARGLWRLSGPIRTPIAGRLDRRHARLMDAAIAGRVEAFQAVTADALARIEHSVNVSRCTHDALAADANLLLDSVVRELGRLQMQVEVLQQIVDDAGIAPRLLPMGGEGPLSRVG